MAYCSTSWMVYNIEAKQELQCRQVNDVDEAIIVEESLFDFWADAAKGRDN